MTGNLTNRIGRIHKTLCLTGGAVGLLLALFPLWFVGKPLPILYLLRADTLLPPLWLMGLLWLGVYALWGGAAVSGVLCALSWLPVHRVSAVLSLAGVLWHGWLLLLQLSVILHN